MSESGRMTEGDEQGVAPVDGSKNQPYTGDYFRVRPLAFLRDFAGNPDAQSSKYQWCAYYATVLWRLLVITASMRVAQIVAIIIACWLTYGFAKDNGYIDNANEVIAAFTIVLACIGLLQWWTTYHQLEAMRLDQRPWLAIKKPEIYYVRNEDEAKFEFDLTNHGKTPCAIRKSLYGVAFELDPDAAMSRAKSSLALRSANEGGVVPPGGTSKAVAVFPVNWTEEQLHAMGIGELYIAVAGIITYGRDELDAYETVFMFGTKTEFLDDLVVLGGAAENYMS